MRRFLEVRPNAVIIMKVEVFILPRRMICYVMLWIPHLSVLSTCVGMIISISCARCMFDIHEPYAYVIAYGEIDDSSFGQARGEIAAPRRLSIGMTIAPSTEKRKDENFLYCNRL